MTKKLKNWPGLKIKRALEDAGVTQTDIAKELGKTQSAVSQVIWKDFQSDAIRRAVAEKVGVSVEEIWPEFYLKDQEAA